MSTLILDRRNISLEYDNQCLVVRQPEQTPRTVPLKHLNKIVCLHSVQITTSLLGQLWKRKIDFVNLNNRHADCSFGLYPNRQQQVRRRCQQYAWQQDQSTALPLARTLCSHRLRNNLRLLPDNGELTLREYLHTAVSRLAEATSLQEMLGIEGAAQRQMFAHWREQLPTKLGFNQRQRRPPKDPVNSLLSLTSSLVLQEAIRQCTAAGLDPDLGFYHRIASGRPSLACDLMEPLRPFFEHWVMHLFIDGKFDCRHFTGQNSAQAPCYLGKAGREAFYPLFHQASTAWQRQLKATARWTCQHLDSEQGTALDSAA
ncbi:MAG: CRISPR-associated endonuclease Cas1 [Gammaproteobacteria bacterium]|nr:CRISPR-associated endonuclease Cas1 [Gammaproteobacteria bacterium]